MSKNTITRLAAMSGFVIASSTAVAWAEPSASNARPASNAQPTAGNAQPSASNARPSALARANSDVLRQLKPSGLKQHGANISRIAGQGYRHFLVTIKAPSAKR